MEKLNNSPIEELVTTNTVPQMVHGDKLKVLCTAPMFAEAIRRIHQSESISCLFRDDSMTDNLL